MSARRTLRATRAPGPWRRPAQQEGTGGKGPGGRTGSAVVTERKHTSASTPGGRGTWKVRWRNASRARTGHKRGRRPG